MEGTTTGIEPTLGVRVDFTTGYFTFCDPLTEGLDTLLFINGASWEMHRADGEVIADGVEELVPTDCPSLEDWASLALNGDVP